jgi:NAD(P)H-quinone oxidoreductase subunit 4
LYEGANQLMLSILIWAPILGVVLLCIPQSLSPERLRQLALAIATLVLIWTVFLLTQFDPSSAGLQFQESLPWIKELGLTYQLGMDGLAMPLIAINSLLTWIAIYSSDAKVSRPRLYYTLILLLGAAVAGAFLAQNLLLFFLFYELELIPLYLLISIWGGARRGYAATKFLIYTAISGILILAAFFGLALLSGFSTFDYEVLRSQTLPMGTQLVLLVTLLLGCPMPMLKLPLKLRCSWQGCC